MFWFKRKPKCDHYFPDFLHGAIVFGRFPFHEGVRYKECLYCRERQSVDDKTEPSE